MKTKEVKKLTQDQLFSELEKLKKEQFNIRFKKKMVRLLIQRLLKLIDVQLLKLKLLLI